MRRKLDALRERVDRLSLRERLFLLAAGLFIVGAAWEAVLAAPLAAREHAASEKVAALKERLEQLDSSLEVAAAGMSEGVPSQLDRLRSLRERVDAGEEEMRVFTTDLVDPTEMRLVLEELLSRQRGLALVSAVNRAARPVIDEDPTAPGAEPGAASAESDAPRLYRHSLVLTLRGSYLDCLTYLQAVERLPWQIYWTRLDFAVDEYPTNDIVIELTTLSLDEEWIGV